MHIMSKQAQGQCSACDTTHEVPPHHAYCMLQTEVEHTDQNVSISLVETLKSSCERGIVWHLLLMISGAAPLNRMASGNPTAVPRIARSCGR
jgi:hypothetical protein